MFALNSARPMMKSLRVLAALLGYPDALMRSYLAEMSELLREERALSPARRAEIGVLIDTLQRGDPLQIEASYVELFDRGRATSLHLFEHVHGDSRERGPAMIDLGQTYAKAGLILAEGELPDYLPAVLEFVSTQPPGEAMAFLGEMAHILNTIVVEANSWLGDNQWLLDLAAEDPFLLGIVGHIDISGDAFSEQVNRFARNPRFRGIRIGSGDISRGLMTGGKLIERCSQLADHNMELDVNGGPDTPQQVATLAAHLPKLRIVINHIGNLPIDGKEPPAAWTEGIENAAKHPGVFCKVSALVEQTRTKPAPQDGAYYLPVLDRLWRAFGEDRLNFGSNWPVSDRGAPLETVVKIVREYFLTKGERAAAKFFAENARAAYRWDD